MIELIAHMPDDVPIDLFVGTPLTNDKLDEAVEALAASGLAEFTSSNDGSRTVSLHRLVKEFARTRYDDSTRKAEIQTLALTISRKLISMLRTKLADDDPLRRPQSPYRPKGTKIFISYRAPTASTWRAASMTSCHANSGRTRSS